MFSKHEKKKDSYAFYEIFFSIVSLQVHWNMNLTSKTEETRIFCRDSPVDLGLFEIV